MVKTRSRSYKSPATTCHGPCLSEHKETEGECLELVLNQMQRLDLLLAASHYCIDCHTTPTPPFISLVIRIAQEQGQFWSSSQLKMEAFGIHLVSRNCKYSGFSAQLKTQKPLS